MQAIPRQGTQVAGGFSEVSERGLKCVKEGCML
jgi:hypothetical protein